MSKNKTQKEQFILIRDWMLDMDFDTASELNIFARIYSFSQGDSDVCWEAASNIGRWGKLEQRSAYTVLKRLEEKGYIEKDSQGAGKTCLYRSIYDPCKNCIGQTDPCNYCIGQSPNPCNNCIGTPAKIAYNNKEDIKDSSILNESISEMEDFNQASSLPTEPTGPVDLTNPASFLRSSSLANSAPSSSTRSTKPAEPAEPTKTSNQDTLSPNNPANVYRELKKTFKRYGVKFPSFNSLKEQLVELINEVVDEDTELSFFVDTAENYLTNSYYKEKKPVVFLRPKNFLLSVGGSAKSAQDKKDGVILTYGI